MSTKFTLVPFFYFTDQEGRSFLTQTMSSGRDHKLFLDEKQIQGVDIFGVAKNLQR